MRPLMMIAALVVALCSFLPAQSLYDGQPVPMTKLEGKLRDNRADAFTIEGWLGDDYIKFVTTDSSEKMVFGNATTNPDFEFLGSGTFSIAGTLDISAATLVATDLWDFDDFDDTMVLDVSTSITGAAGKILSLARTLTPATAENGALMSFTPADATSSTTAQYGLYLDNVASTEALDALLVIDNSDADDAVAAGILFVDGGGGFTTGLNLANMAALNLGSAGTDFSTTAALISTTAGMNATIGNATGTVEIASTGVDISTAGVISGVTGYTQSSGAWTHVGAAGILWQGTRFLTDATAEKGWRFSLAPQDSTSSTTAQYGISLENAATTEAADALLRIDNVDADDTVAAAIQIDNSGAGTGYTKILETATLDISYAGAISGSTGYSQASGTFDIPTAALARGDLATTTKSVWIGAGMTDAAATEASGALYNVDAEIAVARSVFPVMTFDANPNAGGDDTVHITWVVPVGYVTDSARLEVYWIDPAGAVEAAGDDVAFIGTTQAVQAGEALGAAGTAWAGPNIDEVVDTADLLNVWEINIESEDIVVGDHVSLVFEVDESACELAVVGIVEIVGWRLTWTSTN